LGFLVASIIAAWLPSYALDCLGASMVWVALVMGNFWRTKPE